MHTSCCLSCYGPFHWYILAICFSVHAMYCFFLFFFFSSRRRHTRFDCDWSSDVCSSDLHLGNELGIAAPEVASLRAMYERGRTLFDHQQVACTVLGFQWMSEHQRRSQIGRASCRERV